jgi:O-antigen ligase
VERASSIGDGLIALAEHPFTGVGIGQFSAAGGQITAHSTIVQAAAEMGLLGLWALTLLTGAAVVHAVVVVRRDGWLGLRPAAAIGLATYALHGVMAAPANEGLYSGLLPVWGLTAALMLVLSLARPAGERLDGTVPPHEP